MRKLLDPIDRKGNIVLRQNTLQEPNTVGALRCFDKGSCTPFISAQSVNHNGIILSFGVVGEEGGISIQDVNDCVDMRRISLGDDGRRHAFAYALQGVGNLAASLGCTRNTTTARRAARGGAFTLGRRFLRLIIAVAVNFDRYGSRTSVFDRWSKQFVVWFRGMSNFVGNRIVVRSVRKSTSVDIQDFIFEVSKRLTRTFTWGRAGLGGGSSSGARRRGRVARR
jgi:hypothetical protein